MPLSILFCSQKCKTQAFRVEYVAVFKLSPSPGTQRCKTQETSLFKDKEGLALSAGLTPAAHAGMPGSSLGSLVQLPANAHPEGQHEGQVCSPGTHMRSRGQSRLLAPAPPRCCRHGAVRQQVESSLSLCNSTFQLNEYLFTYVFLPK